MSGDQYLNQKQLNSLLDRLSDENIKQSLTQNQRIMICNKYRINNDDYSYDIKRVSKNEYVKNMAINSLNRNESDRTMALEMILSRLRDRR